VIKTIKINGLRSISFSQIRHQPERKDYDQLGFIDTHAKDAFGPEPHLG
jgi:hypothetical protein